MRCSPAALLLGLALPAAGQACSDTLTAADGYLVGRVTLHVRHLAQTALPTRAGDPYNPAINTRSVEQLAGLLDTDMSRNAALDALLSRIPAVSYTSSCTRILPPDTCSALVSQPKCVEVVFSRYGIGVDLPQPGTYTSTEPRSPYASYLGGVPRALKILNPTTGLLSDDRLGPSPSATATVDLLTLPALATGRPAPLLPVSLVVSAAGSHSLQNGFFSAAEDLDLSLNRRDTTLPQLSLHAVRTDSRLPLGAATDTLGSTAAGLELTAHAPFAQFTAWAGFRSENHTQSTEQDFLGTLLADTHAHGLTTRSALWITAAVPSQLPTYQRVAFTTAAYKDFAVATNQSLGVQLGASTGATWGPLPAYAAFYAGNNSAGFLFAGRQTLLTALPAGPTLRSLGTAEGSRTSSAGAAAFFGLTGAVSMPVPRWSRPLIPNVQILDNLTLKTMLKRNAIDTPRNLMIASLIRRGLSPEEAEKQATRVFAQDVAPAVNFVADQANLYAIKPILAVDYARTSQPANFLSLGPGVELTLVNVALQLGYARTVAAPPTTRQGNFFLNLQFRNFF